MCFSNKKAFLLSTCLRVAIQQPTSLTGLFLLGAPLICITLFLTSFPKQKINKTIYFSFQMHLLQRVLKNHPCLMMMMMMMMMMKNFFCGMVDQRKAALFPARTIVRDSHHHKSPIHRKQDCLSSYSSISSTFFPGMGHQCFLLFSQSYIIAKSKTVNHKNSFLPQFDFFSLYEKKLPLVFP